MTKTFNLKRFGIGVVLALIAISSLGAPSAKVAASDGRFENRFFEERFERFDRFPFHQNRFFVNRQPFFFHQAPFFHRNPFFFRNMPFHRQFF